MHPPPTPVFTHPLPFSPTQSSFCAPAHPPNQPTNQPPQIIKALQYDVAKVSKAHNDLIRVYEAKLTEFGIPVDELGFRPLVTNTSTGPAGLVVGA